MPRSRKRARLEECFEPTIGSYYELYFEHVAEGVDYCQRIVPHVVPPFGSLREGEPSSMAVWLHVPRRTDANEHGCFLYMSQAVHEALERVGQPPRTSGTISRVALPDTSVLVFGHDRVETQNSLRDGASSVRATAASRVARYQHVLDNADAVLR